MENERHGHRGRDGIDLYNAHGDDLEQRRPVHRGRQQCGRHRDQQRRHADRDDHSCGAFDNYAASNQTIFAGQTATFSVVANGTSPLSYQWRQNGSAISGATSSSYTTPAETTSNSGATFSVVVSNSVGSATSNNATLTVNPDPVAPTITSQPASQTINAGQTATFSVTASGTAPLSYQWFQNSTAISGATSSSYTTPVETVSNSGTHFSVTVSNSAGSATSNTATLTVNGVIGALNPSTNSLNFNNVTVTTNSVLSVSFTNAGTASITISSATVSGTGFTGSGISNNQVVPAGQSATLNVTFAPTGAGSASGSVTVASNATDPSITVSLLGTGVVHSATLNWTASVTSGVTGYNVYRGTVLGTYTQINPSLVSSNTYTDTQVAARDDLLLRCDCGRPGRAERLFNSGNGRDPVS